MLCLMIEQDGHVLLVRRKEDAPPFAGEWTLPGIAVQAEAEAEALDEIAQFTATELGITLMGQELAESLRLLDGEAEYEIEIYRVGFEDQLRYRSAGPFAETAWATTANLPAPMPRAIQSLLRRLLTLEVS